MCGRMKRNKKLAIVLSIVSIISIVIYVVVQTAFTKGLLFGTWGILAVYLGATHEKLDMK